MLSHLRISFNRTRYLHLAFKDQLWNIEFQNKLNQYKRFKTKFNFYLLEQRNNMSMKSSQLSTAKINQSPDSLTRPATPFETCLKANLSKHKRKIMPMRVNLLVRPWLKPKKWSLKTKRKQKVAKTTQSIQMLINGILK